MRLLMVIPLTSYFEMACGIATTSAIATYLVMTLLLTAPITSTLQTRLLFLLSK